MKTIQIVLDEKLLKAADRAARKGGVNRSALVRDALREHLRRIHLRELEERDRRGYEAHPPTEFEAWDEVRSWPES